MMSIFENEFSHLTGAGIKIGIIDSGYSPGSKNIRIKYGINLTTVETDDQLNDFTDKIGHGTAGVGIIQGKAPEAEIYPVKIFDKELITDVDKLITAIQWCIENELNLINLSLGTTEIANREQLGEICDTALQNNIFIIAAASNDGQVSYPASLPQIFGVTAGKITGKYDYYFDENESVQFIARGNRQRLDWLNGQQLFLGGPVLPRPILPPFWR